MNANFSSFWRALGVKTCFFLFFVPVSQSLCWWRGPNCTYMCICKYYQLTSVVKALDLKRIENIVCDCFIKLFYFWRESLKKKNLRGKKSNTFEEREEEKARKTGQNGHRQNRKRRPDRHGTEQAERAAQRTDQTSFSPASTHGSREGSGCPPDGRRRCSGRRRHQVWRWLEKEPQDPTQRHQGPNLSESISMAAHLLRVSTLMFCQPNRSLSPAGCDVHEGEWIWRLLSQKGTPDGHLWDGLGETFPYPGMAFPFLCQIVFTCQINLIWSTGVIENSLTYSVVKFF